MRSDIQLHDVTEIQVDQIKHYSRSNGEPFYHRSLIVTMADGSKETISLYTSNGYNLLIDDAEIAALNDPVLKVA